ncbi:MAG: nodulation protein NfeD [Porphyromonadaceae bacterium]|nr:nodulation protein NfeD [Porphyromonadaceae bacterium]
MRKRLIFLCLMLSFLFVGTSVVEAASDKPLFYRIDMDKEIGSTTWRYMRKGYDEAQKRGATAIVLRLNTYGGAVVYADSIRTLILNSSLPVYAFVDNNAASAGALIAIACDSIYMREGARMGAATVVDQTGGALPDKYQSYMRATIRATAEAQGRDTVYTADGLPEVRWRRNPLIAEAMVDERLSVPGLCDSTKVLTFTAREALQWNYCEAMVEGIDEIITSRLGYSSYEVARYEPSFYDEVVGFLQNPIVQGVLIMLIIGGIYFEMQTPGVGLPLAVSIIAAVLYFVPLYLSGLAASWEILLFVLGIILLVLEVLVIPGFGIAGILGLIFFFSGLLLALLDNVNLNFSWISLNSLTQGILVIFCGFLGAVVLSLLLMKRIGHKGLFYRVALHADQNIEEGYVAVPENLASLVGREGVTATVMRPSGKVRIDEEDYDAIAYRGSYLEADTPVRVVKVENMQLYIVPLNAEEK